MIEYFHSNSNVVAAIIAVIGVFITAFITFKNNNKNILIKTVTEERAKWRNDLRDIVASFIKEAFVQIGNDAVVLENLYELKAKIIFRLNPNKEHQLDQTIIKRLNRIIENLIKANRLTLVETDLQRLEEEVQILIKREWDKSKVEARTGRVGK